MNLTYILIGITVIVSWISFQDQNTLRKLIMNPYVINTRNEYYRFITSGFIHKDISHLLFNMISLYFFGVVVEQIFQAIFGDKGSIYFIALYVLGIVVSDIPSYFKHRSNPAYNALGASGGVASVIFASIIFLPLNKICLYFALCIPGFILGTLYLIYSYYSGRKANDNINHDAHLYGALFGLIFSAVMYPPSIRNFIEQILAWKMTL